MVINCGSSSLKYQLINSDSEEVLAKGLCERIGIDGSAIVHQPAGGEKVKSEIDMPNHTKAVQLVIEKLTDPQVGVIASLEEIDAVGHRIVHGGERFAGSVVLDDEVLAVIEQCNDLAPLHNPANLIGINSCREIMPDVPMVGVFDTAFHQTMPKKAYLYGLPLSYYEKHKTIQFDTIYEKGTYEVMYVFRSQVYNENDLVFKYYQFINANSAAEFDAYMSEMAQLALYDTGVTASYGDSLLTLSTCDSSQTDGRFVVVAKKIA